MVPSYADDLLGLASLDDFLAEGLDVEEISGAEDGVAAQLAEAREGGIEVARPLARLLIVVLPFLEWDRAI